MLSNKKNNNLKDLLRKAYLTFFEKEKIAAIKYIFIIFYIILLNYHFEYIEIDNEKALYEINIDFSNFKTDIKTIALYLPQFYSFKENDE